MFYQSVSETGCVLFPRSHVCRVGVGEAEEVFLVQIHDDELVCRRQVQRHLGELLVKVTSVLLVLLQVEFMRC